VESTESEVVMDEVAEERPAEKKKSYLGTIIFLVIIVLIASAVWYFQSTWMPHAKQTYQQAQTMMHDFMSPAEIDPMAAPAMSSHIPADDLMENETNPKVIISAVIDDEKQEVAEKEADIEVATEIENVVEKETVSELEIASDAEAETVVQETQEPVINANKSDVEMHGEPMVTFVEEVESSVIEENTAVIKEDSISADMAMDSSIPVVKQDIDVIKSEAELSAARQAFWQRNLPKAEVLYKEQINNSKANANSWGELGNIYYLQAKWQQAAFAYTEAALILLDKGDFPQAMFLRYVISGLDPVQVKRIDERLRKLQAPA